MSPSVEIRKTSVLRMPANPPDSFDPNSPTTPVDLWLALDKMSRDDHDMLAARRDDVRRSRRARRSIAAS